MGISLAELDGVRVTEMTFTLPSSGRWTADVRLDTVAKATSGRVVLTLGTVAWQGFVVRAGDLYGQAQLRLVGGRGGWGRTLPPRFYQSPGGLRLKGVLADAARESGEQLELQQDSSVGSYWTRRRGPASRVLALGPSWWVRPDGVTEVGTRPEPTVTSGFDVFPESDLGKGRILIATDDPGDWAPGVRFASASLPARVYQASAVVHHLTPKQFRTEVWVSP